MTKTIVQEYGPIYGEAVNGTVLGRPNGSVYVPMSNTIAISLDATYRYVSIPGDGMFHFTESDGVLLTDEYPVKVVANSQDLANFIWVRLFDDAAMTNRVASLGYPAGLFNIELNELYAISGTTATTFYLKADLMNGSTSVATSSVIEVEVVSP